VHGVAHRTGLRDNRRFPGGRREGTAAVRTEAKRVHDGRECTQVIRRARDRVLLSRRQIWGSGPTFTFPNEGRFAYQCRIHDHMVGAVVVKD
jgi:hypothetical protein